jgi:hypothetical protein
MAKKGFQTNIQDMIYSVDSGVGLKLIRIILYLLAALSVSLLYTATQFNGFMDEAPMDYAQLARNLADKKGFVTKTVRPQSMAFIARGSVAADPKIDSHPEVYRAPLYPAVMAVSMMTAKAFDVDLFAATPKGQRPSRVFDAERWFAIPANHTFVFLTALFLYLLARRLFNERISFWAVSFYLMSDMVWADSIASIGLPMVSCFVIGSFYFAVRAESSWRQNESALHWSFLLIMSAFFAAFAFLTRYAAGMIGLGIFMFYLLRCWRRRAGWWPPLFFALIFFATITPWLARNWTVSHSPFGLAPFCMLDGPTGASAEMLHRGLDGSFGLSPLLKVAKPMWISTISEVYKSGLFPSGGIMVAFFLVSLTRRFAREDVRALRMVGVGMLILSVLVGALFGAETVRLCHAFWPLVLLFGVAFFFSVLEEMELPFLLLNQVLLGLLVVVAGAGPYLLTLMPPSPKMPTPTYYYPVTQDVCALMKPSEVICTDMPWATAWYGNQTSIQLPTTLDQFYKINDSYRNVKAVYFTLLTKDKRFSSELLAREPAWFNLARGQHPPEFPLTAAMVPLQGQYFLTDYVRWSEVAQREEKPDASAEGEEPAAE